MNAIISFIKNNSPIRLLKNKIFGYKFLKQNPRYVFLHNNESDIDIYIVAFNKPQLIEKQITLLKKNLLDKYNLIIADNSNDEKCAKKIKDICIKNKVNYIRLPENKLKGSHSHWIVLNYLMKNFVLKSKSQYFWFLDHDCFLIKKESIIKNIGNQQFIWLIWDRVNLKIVNRNFNLAWNRRYLWAWCCFFNKNLFKNWYNFLPTKRFLPISFLDTWWWNRSYIYKYYDKNTINKFKVLYDNELWWNISDQFFHFNWASYMTNDEFNKKLEYLIKNY